MGLVKVTSEQLQDLSGVITRGSGDIDKQLGSMRSSLQPLVSGDWEGAASAKFQSLWQEWQQSAAKLKEALDGISVLLGGAAKTYADAESQVASKMGGPS